jgi:hypothetical protein
LSRPRLGPGKPVVRPIVHAAFHAAIVSRQFVDKFLVNNGLSIIIATCKDAVHLGIGENRGLPSMNSLDIFSVRVLMQALERIHSTRDIAEFPQVIFSTLKSLVPGAMVTFDHLDLKTNIATKRISEDSLVGAEVKARVLELMPNHPVVSTLKSGAKGAIRVTDCITQRLSQPIGIFTHI